jgi:uncharacterized lipoprotein YajG
MIQFKFESYIKIIKSITLITGITLMVGCASVMKVNMNVDPASSASENYSESNHNQTGNILVLMTQGESNQTFSSKAPNSIGALVMQNPLNYKLFPVTAKGGKFSFEIPVNQEQSISIYVVGKGLNYRGDSQWKYYFNTLENDRLDLHISNKGVIEKVKT